jgi:hypothetical protein
MESNIKLDFKSQELRLSLEPLCVRVLEHFQFPQRVYIYVADREDPDLTNPNTLYYAGGKYFRGVHTPPEGMHLLPEYLKECVFRPDSELMWLEESPTFLEMLAFEHLIYIRQSTCADVTGFVLTLAHELQHVTQYIKTKTLLRANSLLYHQLARQIDPATTLTAIDIPHEREANIVSKRITESVCGKDALEAFASKQIKLFAVLAKTGDSDAASEQFRWEVFQSIDTSAPFDFQAETVRLFNQYRPQIVALDLGKHYGIDATKEQWWV